MDIKNRLAELLMIEINQNGISKEEQEETREELKRIRRDISENGNLIDDKNIHLYYYIMTIEETIKYKDILNTILKLRFKTIIEVLKLTTNSNGVYNNDEVKLYGLENSDSLKYKELESLRNSILLEYSIFEIHDTLLKSVDDYIELCKKRI